MTQRSTQEVVIRGLDAQCSSRCAVLYRVREGRLVGVVPDPEHPNNIGPCPKGIAGPELLYNSQRVLHPLRRTRPKTDEDPGWEQVSWQEALESVASGMLALKARYGTQSVAFYRGAAGGTSIGANQSWIMRLAHAYGTPNFITTGHICNWHRDSASAYTFGVGLPAPDFENTNCIFIWGHNPHATQRTNQVPLEKALARGAKLVVVDPRRIPIAERADLWLPVRPGTDGALALGLINVLLETRGYDRDFVTQWTDAPFLVRSDTNSLLTESDLRTGGDAASYLVWDAQAQQPGPAKAVKSPALEGAYEVALATGSRVEAKTAFQLLRERAAAFTPERVAEVTGIAPPALAEAAQLLAKSRGRCYWTYNGVEQQTNAAYTNRALCVLYALTGDFDAPGGNVIFPRLPLNSIEAEDLVDRQVARGRLGWPEHPLGKGNLGKTITAYDAFNAMLTSQPYPVRGLVSFGGNLITCTGDSLTGRRALQSLDLFAQVEFFLTPAAQLADYVLPAACPWEAPQLQTGFRGSLTGYLQYTPAVVEPQGEARPDLEIIFELAKHLGVAHHFWEGNIEAAWDYQLAPTRVSVEELKRHPGGMAVPLEVRYRKYQGKGFATPTGRVEVFSQTFRDRRYDPLPAYQESLASLRGQPEEARYPLLLINSKVQEFCHGQHRAVPSLRQQVPHPYLEIHPSDAAPRGIQDGEWLKLETKHGAVRVMARVTEGITPGVVNTQHGWWQSCPELGLPGYDPYSSEGANVNLLVTNDLTDPVSGSVPHKGYPCEVRKA
ncbi:MAG: molybdopterin-dependent oxidoreductase [Chloroflexi bacterium]|nr:molybdopterin-dependent oxidoreductase [Chloroflexota bacterium]